MLAQRRATAFSAGSRPARAPVVQAAAAGSRARAVSVRNEISYVMVKPDGVQRGLVGEIIGRFERKGFKLRALKLYSTPKEVAEEHYKDLSSKPFYKDLVQYILSGPVVAMVWEGDGVVASARKLIGATNPLASEPGTIRGDLAIEVGRNVIHGSDSPDNGERETALWFPEGLVKWDQTLEPWLKE
ncbi:nucleoside diphosphate kinase chloroplastic [Raphidocelis subcapitata]|uniref:Nucleoside diphosphate kinase n=1 Tax=Raphidocelis subcapitata TaxID=307507 RepID=A0A2V0P5A2_9CHLO|nr:nucleoside diphosphate kinase chloroplastic [Raphidocelis subcapitata]|eukprot:GBF95054.1 nucleoside diphosphate kinase chloroplastic [Raphidocelis subcapitata]